jgi:LmbE family N-acetylglucosaminyl deacetylase
MPDDSVIKEKIMELLNPSAELFIPDGTPAQAALLRTTHLAVGAHQDDLEIMAADGIIACFQQPDKWFTGVVVTNGSGSPRSGVYAEYSDEDMVKVRAQEQKKAAFVGEYAAQFLLNYPSSVVKDAADASAVEQLEQILLAARPQVVYTHNLADKHDTHVGVTLKLLEAIRRLPKDARPEKLYGCEVWRDLDWMVDTDKVTFDLSAHENLHAALVGVFDSQIAGGKRYDLATLGRRRAHATYSESHGVDETTGASFSMDLTALVHNPELDPLFFVIEHCQRFVEDIKARFGKVRGG